MDDKIEAALFEYIYIISQSEIVSHLPTSVELTSLSACGT